MAKGHLVKRGKVWYARFYDDTGQRQWQSLQYNLEFFQKNRRDKKIKGFTDTRVDKSFKNLEQVVKIIREKDQTPVIENTEELPISDSESQSK